MFDTPEPLCNRTPSRSAIADAIGAPSRIKTVSSRPSTAVSAAIADSPGADGRPVPGGPSRLGPVVRHAAGVGVAVGGALCVVALRARIARTHSAATVWRPLRRDSDRSTATAAPSDVVVPRTTPPRRWIAPRVSSRRPTSCRRLMPKPTRSTMVPFHQQRWMGRRASGPRSRTPQRQHGRHSDDGHGDLTGRDPADDGTAVAERPLGCDGPSDCHHLDRGEQVAQPTLPNSASPGAAGTARAGAGATEPPSDPPGITRQSRPSRPGRSPGQSRWSPGQHKHDDDDGGR